MSHQNRLTRLFLGDQHDVRIAKIGLVVSLSLLGLRLLAEQILFVVIPVAGATAFGLYLVTRRREAAGFERLPYRSETVGYLPSLVVLGLASFLILLRLGGGRTLGTHLLAGGIAAGLFAQIFLLEDRSLSPGLLLAQILLVSVVLRLGTLFVTPGFIGVDIWSHVPVFVSAIAETGSLAPIAEYKYIMAPIYHLNGAVATLVFGDPRAGVYLTLGTLLALAAILLYSTARLVVPARWALGATALFAFSDQFIRWGLHLIPTSLGLVFFLGALYALTKLYYRVDLRLVWLLSICSLAIVFTHQVSTAVVLLVLAVASLVSLWATLRTAGDATITLRTTGILSVFAVTLGMTVLSWANTPFSGDFVFLWRMIDVVEVTLADAGFLNLASGGASGAPAAQSGLLAELASTIEWFGFGILLGATLLGAMILARRTDSRELTYTYVFAFGAMFATIYGLSLFGVRTFLPGRWLAFLFAPMAVLGACGLYYVSEHASRRVVLAVVLLVAVGYPMTMLVTEKATLDSPAFEEENPRFAYSEAEIQAVHTISEIRPPAIEAELRTDHPYRSLYDRLGGYDTPALQVDDRGQATAGAVVHREYQLEGPTMIRDTTEEALPQRSNTYLSGSVCTPSRNHLYTNEAVTLCTGGER